MIGKIGRRQEPEPDGAAADAARPTMETAAPAWFELTKAWARLCGREVEILAELGPLNERVRKSGGYAVHENVPAPPPPQAPKAHRPGVLRLIGELAPPPVVDTAPPKAYAADKAKALELGQELEDIRESRRLLLPLIRRELHLGSLELCNQLRPEYDAEIARPVIVGLVGLAAAWRAHEAWVADLRKQGCAFAVLKPLFLFGVEEPDGTPIDKISRSLRWAKEAGHAAGADIPSDLLR